MIDQGDLSKRTLARYARALRFMDFLESDTDASEKLIKKAMHPSTNRLSFSKLEQLAEGMVALKIVRDYPDERD